MKKTLLILALVFSLQNVFSQMDERFYHPDKEWIGINFPQYEEIILPVDNDTIYSLIVKPTNNIKATVIYFHGNGGNISKWADRIQPFVDNNYQVCIMDYRGFGKSTGKPTHLNIAHDAQILFDTLMQNNDIANTPLIVYGASIGSQVATLITKNNNEKISALVLDGAMASFTDVALATTPPDQHEIIKQYVTSPYSAKENMPFLKDLKVLFIHSEKDFIPIQEAREMYNNTQCKKEFWTYEGKHVDASVNHPALFMEYIDKLLK